MKEKIIFEIVWEDSLKKYNFSKYDKMAIVRRIKQTIRNYYLYHLELKTKVREIKNE